MEKQTYAVGERVDELCAVCLEERGHVAATVTRRGRISRVACPKCGTRSTFKRGVKGGGDCSVMKTSAPYDRTLTYSTGQVLMHPTYGAGEVTAVIESQKIDVLFADRVRRLIHAHLQA